MLRAVCSRWGMLALLLILVKGLIVLSLGDVFFYGEELEKGTAAKAILDGLSVPHYQLAYHYYEGGGFVISHCVAFAFLIVGQNLLALKLVAIGYQLLILSAGCWMTWRLFGRQAATCFGVLYVLGPASYQKLSLLCLGVHFEAGLFLFVALALGSRLLFTSSERRLDWFLLGIVCGFGVYFSYMTAVVGLWLAILILGSRRKLLFGPCGLCAILGTAIGLIPWFVMYAYVGNALFDIHGVELLDKPAGPSNLALFGETLDSVFFDEDGTLALTTWVRAAMFLGALVFLLRRREPEQPSGESPGPTSRSAALYLAGYIALFLIVFLSSGFVQGRLVFYFYYLRLVSVWLVGTAIVAGALAVLWSSPTRKWRAAAVLGFLVLLGLGLFDSGAALNTGRPGQLAANWDLLLRHKGYAYPQYFEKVWGHFECSPADKLRLVEEFRDPAPGLVRASAVSTLLISPSERKRLGKPGKILERIGPGLEVLAEGDEVRLSDYWLGLGQLIVVANGGRRAQAMRWASHLPAAQRDQALEAVGRFGWRGYPSRESLREALRRASNHPKMEAYIRGLGRWTYRQYRLDPAGFEPIAQALPEEVARELRTGFEAEQAWALLPKRNE